MKKVYEKPDIKKVELRPEEAVLQCSKCPGNSNSPTFCNQIGGNAQHS